MEQVFGWGKGRKPKPPANGPFLTIFLIDGLEYSVFHQLLADGKLPTIRRFMEEGGQVVKGVTAFPSMTGYAFWPLITGYDAVYSGILGLRWFNRSFNGHFGIGFRNYVGKTNIHMNADTVSNIKTLYELFPNVHTYSAQTYMNRGVDTCFKTAWGFTTAKYHDQHSLFRILKHVPLLGQTFQNWKSYEQEVIENAIEDLKLRPKIQWITFASPDTCCHVKGTREEYIQTIIDIDACIARYQKASIDLGQEGDRTYLICSDHGMVNVNKNIDIGSQLTRLHGFRPYSGPSTYLFSDRLDNSLNRYDNYDAIVAINGNVMAFLYFRHPYTAHPWIVGSSIPNALLRQYPLGEESIDIVQTLIDIEGIEFVILQGEGNTCIEIHSKQGKGMIFLPERVLSSSSLLSSPSSTADGVVYAVMEGKDPLNYPPELYYRALSAEEWLRETIDSDYPYAIVRLWKLFHAAVASPPDIIVTMQAGYDLGKDFELFVGNYKGGHGGLRKDQMIVPYIFKGPSIQPGSIVPQATVEDVGKTLFRIMGLPLPPSDANILETILKQ